MILIYILGTIIVIFFIVVLFFYIATDFPLRKRELGFEYVYVEEDGSVRELYLDEIEYLNTDFPPSDSGRPSIKYRYSQKTPDNKIWGFIKRKRVPRQIIIKSIDADQARLDELYKHVK